MSTTPAQDYALRHWYRRSILSTLLLPLAALFALVAALRRWLYRTGRLHSVRLPVPVLVVGNLTVGGTGKTPLVLWLAQMLHRSGKSPGIVMRGYAGRDRGQRGRPRRVESSSNPEAVGDEAVLLAGRSGCPVWVGSDRVDAALALLAANPRCDVLVCDDGLQHYRIARDFEIAVEDDRGHGNGRLLPAGPLREPASRRVDVTVINSADDLPLPKRNSAVLRTKLEPGELLRINVRADADQVVGVDSLRGKRLHAIAGIGNPTRFFATLRKMGLKVVEHAFPDHHAYIASDLDFTECDAVLMTEKDAVKCRALAGGEMIALRVDAVPDPELAEMILRAVAKSTSNNANFQETCT